MMPGVNIWFYVPLPNSSIEECEKYRNRQNYLPTPLPRVKG